MEKLYVIYDTIDCKIQHITNDRKAAKEIRKHLEFSDKRENKVTAINCLGNKQEFFFDVYKILKIKKEETLLCLLEKGKINLL